MIFFVCFERQFFRMPVPLKQLIGSIISSFFGPYKSNKLVIDDNEDACMLKCPVLLLQKMKIKDHFSCLLEETLNSHHMQYGCSSMSLLTMWYLWNEEFQMALQEGCEITDIIEHSQNILELVISHLSGITIFCDKILLKKDDEQSNFQLQESTSTFSPSKRQTQNTSNRKHNNFKNSSKKIPILIQYSSRHFSPSQSHYKVEEQETPVGNADEKKLNNNCPKKIAQAEKLKASMLTLVEKLSHGASELTNIVYKGWISQIESSDCVQFNIDGLVICPVTLPSSYSTVVDGLIIKSNIRYHHDQDLNIEKSRALIIKGNITFEYTHLGYSQNISITLKKSPEQLQISSKDRWIRKCCDLLLDLEINCLLVTGEVDPVITDFCFSNSIFLLPCISWNLLEVLCMSVNESPCVYLLECDSENVISSLKLKKWNFENADMGDDLYVHIGVSNQKSIKRIYSIILCHPNQLVLMSQEHQFWHFASRLHLATKESKLLPGGGETEKWCSDFLQQLPSENDTRERIKLAIQRGFLNYSEMLLEKIKNSNEMYSEEAVDEMQSKIQSWRSALALILVLLQCDCLIVNGCDDSVLDDNLIAFL